MGQLGASAKHTLRFSPGRERRGLYLDANLVRSGGFATGGGNFLAPGLRSIIWGRRGRHRGVAGNPRGTRPSGVWGQTEIPATSALAKTGRAETE